MREGLAWGADVHLDCFGGGLVSLRCGLLRRRAQRGRGNQEPREVRPLHSVKPHRKIKSGSRRISMAQLLVPPQYFLDWVCGIWCVCVPAVTGTVGDYCAGCAALP